MELSADECMCLASSAAIGHKLSAGLGETTVKIVSVAKALGSGLGAGTRRITQVLQARLKNFRKRRSRFAALRRNGIDTARILRTGGTVVLVYGSETMGGDPLASLGPATGSRGGGSTAVRHLRTRPGHGTHARRRVTDGRGGSRIRGPQGHNWTLGNGSMALVDAVAAAPDCNRRCTYPLGEGSTHLASGHGAGFCFNGNYGEAWVVRGRCPSMQMGPWEVAQYAA